MSHRPVVLTGRHRPHEVVFLAFSAIIGAAFMIGAKPPGTLERLVPPPVLWSWYALLLASGVVGLISITVADPYRALVLERTAMLGHTVAPAMYSIALGVVGTATATFTVAFLVAWSVASGWRVWQVNKDLRLFREAGGEQVDGGEP